MKVIKAFVQEGRERQVFDAVNQGDPDGQHPSGPDGGLHVPLYAHGGRHQHGPGCGLRRLYRHHGGIDVGQFSSFIMFLNNLIWPMAAIGRIINILTQGSASMSVWRPSSTPRPTSATAPGRLPGDPQGSVEARDLTFAYPGADKPALEHVSFRLEKDRPLGVVGRTGSGKTTLVNLIMRIFDPGEGCSAIGGREIPPFL